MTKDEALDTIEWAVEQFPAGQFDSLEDAFKVAATALNYVFDNIETSEEPKWEDHR